jgi:ribosomal protein S18 acetylase RimI-like enzyme
MISIETAAAAPWSDVEHAMTGGGDGASCWCQWFMVRRSEFDSMTRDQRRERFRREVADASPGLIAYVDGSPAGWVRVAPRPEQGRLGFTRVVKSGSPEPLDADDVWAITCLVVRREFRGQGVARHLLAAAVGHAEKNGARAIEAYPFDIEQGTRSNNELYVGSVPMFEELAFEETARPTAARVVMTRRLAQ